MVSFLSSLMSNLYSLSTDVRVMLRASLSMLSCPWQYYHGWKDRLNTHNYKYRWYHSYHLRWVTCTLYLLMSGSHWEQASRCYRAPDSIIVHWWWYQSFSGKINICSWHVTWSGLQESDSSPGNCIEGIIASFSGSQYLPVAQSTRNQRFRDLRESLAECLSE